VQISGLSVDIFHRKKSDVYFQRNQFVMRLTLGESTLLMPLLSGCCTISEFGRRLPSADHSPRYQGLSQTTTAAATTMQKSSNFIG